MHQEVRNRWMTWNTQFEGAVPFMYLDIKGLVTIGIGDLIDSVGQATQLLFYRQDGDLATEAEIAAEWHLVKSRQDMRMRGGMAYGAITKLHLSATGVEDLVLGKLEEMEKHLAARFPEWSDWPWQAQMATLSMSWAAGPALHAPHWEMACRTWDWALAAAESHLDDSQNPGLRPRNAANKALFLEAAALPDTPANETNASDTLEGPSCH